MFIIKAVYFIVAGSFILVMVIMSFMLSKEALEEFIDFLKGLTKKDVLFFLKFVAFLVYCAVVFLFFWILLGEPFWRICVSLTDFLPEENLLCSALLLILGCSCMIMPWIIICMWAIFLDKLSKKKGKKFQLNDIPFFLIPFILFLFLLFCVICYRIGIP
jgi:hypothetical protein